jgi:RNA polymerase sigma factor (sigma-70 family)
VTWRIPDAQLARLARTAKADRWGLAPSAFAAALQRALSRAFPDTQPSERDLERHLGGLHLEDLALAAACADGHDAAWEHFIREYRPLLYRAADAIDPTGTAREHADALYADLYGTRERDGERQSLFRYFHGRSSLSTWLRAVLSQRHVDGIRSRRRLEPLPADAESMEAPPSAASAPDPDCVRLVGFIQRALTIAVAALSARDRLRLASYYTEQLTLAQTGRILGEHEATVSRQLARTRAALRTSIEERLRLDGLAPDQIARSFECVLEDPGPLDLSRIVRKDSAPDRSI